MEIDGKLLGVGALFIALGSCVGGIFWRSELYNQMHKEDKPYTSIAFECPTSTCEKLETEPVSLPKPVTELEDLIRAVSNERRFYKHDPNNFTELVDYAASNLTLINNPKLSVFLTSFSNVAQKMDNKQNFGSTLVDRLYALATERFTSGYSDLSKDEIDLATKVAAQFNLPTSNAPHKFLESAYAHIKKEIEEAGYRNLIEKYLTDVREITKIVNLPSTAYELKLIPLAYANVKRNLDRKDYSSASNDLTFARTLATTNNIDNKPYEQPLADIAYSQAQELARTEKSALDPNHDYLTKMAKEICSVPNTQVLEQKALDAKKEWKTSFPKNPVCTFAEELAKANHFIGYEGKCAQIASLL